MVRLLQRHSVNFGHLEEAKQLLHANFICLSSVKIIDLTEECKVIASIDKSRTSYLKFSPLGSYLILWETFYG